MQQQKKYTHGALTAPDYPESLPQGCKWLGSEGYGVWFLLTKENALKEGQFRIRRYKDTGVLDCDRIFELKTSQSFDINQEFEFGYLSHCQQCVVYQDDEKFVFTFLEEYQDN
jgi:hypothetical protein